METNTTPSTPDSAGLDAIQSTLDLLARPVSSTSKARTRSRFAATVLSISADRRIIKVRICTGAVFDIPTSVLRNVKSMGMAQSDTQSWSLAAADLDTSTSEGTLIHQMACEIDRLARFAKAAEDASTQPKTVPKSPATISTDGIENETSVSPFDNVLPEQFVKIPFSGIAGFPKAITYGPSGVSEYIVKWSVFNTVNSRLVSPPSVVATGGPTGRPPQLLELQFVLDAKPGTVFATPYNGELILDVTLSQFTV